jgi:tetratricopeptide (TPR) repeat protein
VRDALYESLVGPARAELHLAVATEIERRAAARLIEVAEPLAHHYARSSATDKAIEYLTMAGRKSLGIYSLNEAERFFRQALTLARSQAGNRLDERSIDILAELARVLTLQFKSGGIIALVEPEADAIARFVANAQVPILLYFYGFALFTARRYREGRTVQDRALQIAEKLDDRRAKAYAIAGVIFLSTVSRPLPLEEFRQLAAVGLSHAESANEVYLVGSLMMSVAWNYSLRGLVLNGAEWARRLLAFGRDRRDARAIAIASWMSGWLDVLGEDYASAIQRGTECITAATSPVDRMMGSLVIANAQILSGRVAEGMALIRHVRAEAEANNWTQLFAAIDGPLGVAMVLSGRINEGLSWLTAFVRRGDDDGHLMAGDFARLFLAEIYLSVLVGDRRPPLRVVARNVLTLLKARLSAPAEAERLLTAALRNQLFSPSGVFHARIEFNLGRLYRTRRRLDLARAHFERARVAASEQKAAAMLARIDANLAAISASPV